MSECQTITIAQILTDMGFSVPNNLVDYLDVLEDALFNAWCFKKEEVRKKETRMQAAKIRNQTKKNGNCSCEVCGSTKELNMHHILPVTIGGSNDEENISWLCCKHHRMVHREHSFSIEEYTALIKKLREDEQHE